MWHILIYLAALGAPKSLGHEIDDFDVSDTHAYADTIYIYICIYMCVCHFAAFELRSLAVFEHSVYEHRGLFKHNSNTV